MDCEEQSCPAPRGSVLVAVRRRVVGDRGVAPQGHLQNQIPVSVKRVRLTQPGRRVCPAPGGTCVYPATPAAKREQSHRPKLRKGGSLFNRRDGDTFSTGIPAKLVAGNAHLALSRVIYVPTSPSTDWWQIVVAVLIGVVVPIIIGILVMRGNRNTILAQRK